MEFCEQSDVDVLLVLYKRDSAFVFTLVKGKSLQVCVIYNLLIAIYSDKSSFACLQYLLEPFPLC